jgi:Gnt-I system high-affinity gluconate transporter
MTILAVVAAVALLVALIGWLKFQPFLAFIIAAIAAALIVGLPLAAIPKAIEKGVGDLLGPLSIIICLGAMFGKLIAESGGAQRIATSLVGLFGPRLLPLALAITGFVVGIPLFYNVGFVLLVPLVFSLAYRAQLPTVIVAVPLMAGLSIAHGFLPPHPSPVALVAQLHADMGLTLIYGMIVGVPTLLIAGPVFARTLRSFALPAGGLFASDPIAEEDLPGSFNAFACALLPVLLIAAATLLGYATAIPAQLREWIGFLGNPTIVMLLSLAVATVALGTMRGLSLARLMESYGSAVRDIAGILLIIAGAGALKQVFTQGGIDAALAALLQGLPFPPLVLGWAVAFAIRVALGSATVAGLTAVGIVAPLAAATGADPNLMVLAIGAGSLMCSHVNDSGFWMFKEYFGLSLRDTFRSWTLMETLVGSCGLVFVLILDAAI